MHENPRLARRCIPLLYNGTVHSRPTEKKKKKDQKIIIHVEHRCSTTLLPDLIACLNTARRVNTLHLHTLLGVNVLQTIPSPPIIFS